MPYKIKNDVRHKFKKKTYNNRDWKAYSESLRNRGSLTIWFSEDAISAWYYKHEKQRKRGRQKVYSDLAIETAYTLRLVYKQPLRQTQGFMQSIVQLLELDLSIPDYTTVSRLSKTISLKKEPLPSHGSKVVIIDSTGLKVVGEKEWMSHKHCTRQRKTWRKLHLYINEEGEILSSSLTHHLSHDVKQIDTLLSDIETPIKEFIGGGAYYYAVTYDSINKHQQQYNSEKSTKVIVPPNTGFRELKERDPGQRLENGRFIENKGRIAW